MFGGSFVVGISGDVTLKFFNVGAGDGATVDIGCLLPLALFAREADGRLELVVTVLGASLGIILVGFISTSETFREGTVV